MNEALVVKEQQGLTREQTELIKRTVAKGATADELALFLHIANRTGLDPFARQIHAIKRWSQADGREVMAVQTGIDGYRLVAERTGKYCPGKETTFKYDKDKLIEATAYVLKLTVDGQWHEVAASARFSEYAGKKKDGSLTAFWADKPHIMLAKVAESLALRRAFPMDLSGLYTFEEMDQADQPAPVAPVPGNGGNKTLDSIVTEARAAIPAAVLPQVEPKPVEATVMPPEKVDKYPNAEAALLLTDGVKPECKLCRGGMSFRPAGVSAKTGKGYGAFWSCDARCGGKGNWSCGDWVDEYHRRLNAFQEPEAEPAQDLPF